MMKRLALACCALVFSTAAASQDEDPHVEVAQELEQASRLGSADVRIMGFNLYKAELWTEESAPFDFERPFALSLTYKRPFSAQQLSRSSVREIARILDTPQRKLAPLGSKLETCFADVQEGDRITGTSDGTHTATFFVNGQRSCEITEPEFSDSFFSIWLGDQTRDLKSRAKLLGEQK